MFKGLIQIDVHASHSALSLCHILRHDFSCITWNNIQQRRMLLMKLVLRLLHYSVNGKFQLWNYTGFVFVLPRCLRSSPALLSCHIKWLTSSEQITLPAFISEAHLRRRQSSWLRFMLNIWILTTESEVVRLALVGRNVLLVTFIGHMSLINK